MNQFSWNRVVKRTSKELSGFEYGRKKRTQRRGCAIWEDALPQRNERRLLTPKVLERILLFVTQLLQIGRTVL